MAEGGALRPPGRARGVDDDGRVVEGDGLVQRGWFACVRSRAGQRLELGAERHPPDGGRPVAGDRRGGGGEVYRVHQHRRPAVGGDVGELGGGEPPVERHEHPAERRGGEQRVEQRRVVGAQVRDPVTPPDTQVTQGAGQAAAPIVQLGVGAGGVAVPHRDPVGDRRRRRAGHEPSPWSRTLPHPPSRRSRQATRSTSMAPPASSGTARLSPRLRGKSTATPPSAGLSTIMCTSSRLPHRGRRYPVHGDAGRDVEGPLLRGRRPAGGRRRPATTCCCGSWARPTPARSTAWAGPTR